MDTKDMILINGDVVTLSQKSARAKSVVIREGKIVEIDPSLPSDITTTAAERSHRS